MGSVAGLVKAASRTDALSRRVRSPVPGSYFNPATGAYCRIACDTSFRYLESARSAVVDGARLYVVHDDGLRVFEIVGT
jgi:hypothetical protein